MANQILVRQPMRMSYDIGSDVTKVGGWSDGLIYHMYYQGYSYTIEFSGAKLNTEARREAVKAAVKKYAKENGYKYERF